MTDIDSDQRNHGILKRDARGRVRTQLRQREALLDEFERSGLSGPKFSEVSGVCYQTLTGWIRKRRRARGGDGTAPLAVRPGPAGGGGALLRWVEAETGMPDGGRALGDLRPGQGTAVMPLRVKLAGGVEAEVSHEGQLSLVVELVRRLNVPLAKPC